MQKNLKSCNFFYLLAHPAETAYLSFRDRELSNDVQLVEVRRRKVVVHTFLLVVPGHCLRAGFMESRNFFVLRPILVKFHIRTRLIESFPTTVVVVRRRKVALHTGSHLTPIEA